MKSKIVVGDLVIVTSPVSQDYKVSHKDWYAMVLEYYKSGQIFQVRVVDSGDPNVQLETGHWFPEDCLTPVYQI